MLLWVAHPLQMWSNKFCSAVIVRMRTAFFEIVYRMYLFRLLSAKLHAHFLFFSSLSSELKLHLAHMQKHLIRTFAEYIYIWIAERLDRRREKTLKRTREKITNAQKKNSKWENKLIAELFKHELFGVLSCGVFSEFCFVALFSSISSRGNRLKKWKRVGKYRAK